MPAFTSRQLKVVALLLPVAAAWVLGRHYLCGLPGEQPARPPARYVYEVRGAVALPGIVSFDMPRSIRELVNERGGQTDMPGEYDHPLAAGTRVVVGKGIQLETMDAAARLLFFMPLSLNRSTAEDFALIPGIGPRTARAIVAFRERIGEIRDLDELMQVRGIGPRKLEAMRPYLGVP